MGDAGVGVDLGHKGLQLLLRNSGGAESGTEAKLRRLEVGSHPPDQSDLLHAPHTVQGVLLGNAELFSKSRIRMRNKGKGRLDDVQKAFVDKVKLRLFHGAVCGVRRLPGGETGARVHRE